MCYCIINYWQCETISECKNQTFHQRPVITQLRIFSSGRTLIYTPSLIPFPMFFYTLITFPILFHTLIPNPSDFFILIPTFFPPFPKSQPKNNP